MTKKSGLADSPFFSSGPVYTTAFPSVGSGMEKNTLQIREPQPIVTKETSRLPDKQTSRVSGSETSRLPDFEHYEVPDYRKMQRIEVRLTWEQNKYLDDLEALIGRDAPEGEKSDPNWRRITKNSIIRVTIEILRTLDVEVDASRFKSERDLLIALHEILKNRFSDPQTSRLPE